MDSTPPPIAMLLLAGHDLRGGEIHRVEAGGAKAIDLHAGDAVAIAGDKRGGARDIGGRLADRIDHAHHHVIDQRGVEIIAALDGAERLARQIERGHFVQRAVDLAAAARRAHVIVDEGVGHEFLLPLRHSRDSGRRRYDRPLTAKTPPRATPWCSRRRP